jgi:hypothetical protein
MVSGLANPLRFIHTKSKPKTAAGSPEQLRARQERSGELRQTYVQQNPTRHSAGSLDLIKDGKVPALRASATDDGPLQSRSVRGRQVGVQLPMVSFTCRGHARCRRSQAAKTRLVGLDVLVNLQERHCSPFHLTTAVSSCARSIAHAG